MRYASIIDEDNLRQFDCTEELVHSYKLFKCWEFKYPEESMNDTKFQDVKRERRKCVEVSLKAFTSFINTGRKFKL